MRYRKLTPDGDYSVNPSSVFLINSVETVAQAILTRLKLLTGEWFLDAQEGLDTTAILGTGTQSTRDVAVRSRILGTPGVVSITAYESSVDADRNFVVTSTVTTLYGITEVTVSL